MAKVNIRYLRDLDGDRYFPMTHVDALVGLEQFDDSEDIESLSGLVNKLNIRVSAQESEITTLKNENRLIKEEIKEIKTLLDELKEPPKEEGDK
ncbi:hypothetical protein [Mammaliicoccus sp. A-M4]|uniref:hypothetical protein n=1 Tax=Mammaliicoccus sp. A-M4 TaxID=2898664 RepID=UPI001EFC2450|nr:hypothetical protein [Mammaliicoccus sp. A-M4]